MEKSGSKRVVITGVSGYLASWVLKYFLESDQNFEIRGTVRDSTNVAKVNPLREAIGADFDCVELVSADITDKKAIDKAVEGCHYVIHTASPVLERAPKDPELLYKPAVEGTQAVLEACRKHKVERLVVTSSLITIVDYDKLEDEDTVTEKDWLESFDPNSPYPESKLRAEKAVWKFLEELPEEEKFDILTLHPGFILGPLLFKNNSVSPNFGAKVMQGKMPGIPDIHLLMVDVRDIAMAHLLAVTSGAKTGRYIVNEDHHPGISIGEIFYEEFGKYGYKPNRKKLKHCLVKLAACCIKDVRPVLKYWGKKVSADHSKSVKELGMKYRTQRETIVDMGYSLIEHGMVKDRTKKKKS
ncbi:unnamed protein product [Moneuplotes crassus]|uniref:NAD-dependent epimerase/dehydratase domain-containing protein n=1 Tax=Euplotes crassus TaxID=5936 RepID=A0AAD1XC19_EUPCR|nr:unnamed protein product [Moneuplotes crassus]